MTAAILGGGSAILILLGVAFFLIYKRGQDSIEKKEADRSHEEVKELARQDRVVAANPDTDGMRTRLSDALRRKRGA